MTCQYCNAENDDSTDRCTSCLKHLPHVDQIANPVAAAAPAASELLEPITPVRPNQPVSSTQISALIVTGLLAGLVVGGIYFAVSRLVDIFLIFPIAFGILIGSIIGKQVTKRHIRNVSVVGICAVLAGILAYGTKITCEAYALRPLMIQELGQNIAEQRGVSQDEGQLIAAEALTPWMTVKIYLENLADVGVRIGHVGTTDTNGAAITGVGLWLLLFLECALIVGFAGIGAVTAASAPYCESCRAWRKTEIMIRKHPSQAPQLVDLVRRQDWTSARNLPLAGSIGDKVICRVSALYCPKCQGGSLLVTSTINSRTSSLFAAELSKTGMQGLRSVDQTSASGVAPTVVS